MLSGARISHGEILTESKHPCSANAVTVVEILRARNKALRMTVTN
jgi:hypothetical protein